MLFDPVYLLWYSDLKRDVTGYVALDPTNKLIGT